MKTLSEKRTGFLMKMAVCIVPEIETLDDRGRERFLNIIDDTLATRPPAIRRQFGFFLDILRLSAIFRRFKPLDRLGPDEQGRVLRRFQHSSNNLLRRGLWGLKTLVFMGYYGQTQVAEKIRYTPSLNGNEMLDVRKRV